MGLRDSLMKMAERQPEKLPECRWTAVHKKCGEEAFGYALDRSHEDFTPWIGAIIYKRGSRPFKLTEERLARGLTCFSCKGKIKEEKEIAIAPEIFTVKSLLRFFEIYDDYYKSLTEHAENHVRILEYGAMLGITFEAWSRTQETHDQHVAHTKRIAEGFLNLCAFLGKCDREPKKPSELVRANSLTDLQSVARATGNSGLTEE